MVISNSCHIFFYKITSSLNIAVDLEPASLVARHCVDPDEAEAGLSSELQTEAMAAAWRERTEAGTNLYTVHTECT